MSYDTGARTEHRPDVDVRDRPTQRISEHRQDETKPSFMTTEFWAMAGLIVAILAASAYSDSLGDVRAWTLVAAVAIGYIVSRGLAKSGTKYTGAEDPLNRNGN